ncbi:MAG: NlpC/P60 family protein [Acetivibrionales bacterium]|jgi:cell wall-associated NlpC family hydrolase|nr:NlpC/P60 family protein [Bacillota bacterium]HOA54882.1 NlpC/P60 family protein [Clostridiales bacterium]HPZ05968.1 NlpC/P60 family protein [Clostridiales bacterium]
MSQKKKRLVSLFALLLVVTLSAETVLAYSNIVLRKGMRGNEVYALQEDLYKLGFMKVKPTGYYGDITRGAVLKLQKKYDLLQDGIAGKQTLGKLDSLMGRDAAADAKKASTSRSTSRAAEDVINYARRYLGVKYVWGGSTSKGFDCSGFVQYVYKHFGIKLNRTSATQAKNGSHVKKANLKPGDLVFFDTNGKRSRINHVGIYIGDGKMIHSSSYYKGVVITDISSGFYAKTYMTARRVLK